MPDLSHARYRKMVFLLISVLLMAAIFWFSSRTGSQSQSQSDAFLPWLPSWIPASWASYIIRKSAHFCVYAALGFSWLFALMPALRHPLPRKPILPAWGICTLYAAFDELHQHFVPGRSGQFDDILLDSIGSLCGIAFALLTGYLIVRFFCQNRSKKQH